MARKQANPDVLDAAPDGAVDVGEMAQQASTAVSVFSTLPVWEPHPTLVEIAKMKEEKLALIADVATPGGLKACKEARREIVRLCNVVDDRRKEVGRDALEYKRGVDKVGNTVITKLREISDPLEAAIRAEEQKEIQAALEKAQAIEAEQRRKEDERLALIAAEEKRRKDEAEAALAKQREELEAGRKALAAQQAEFMRQQEEMMAERERLNAETKRIEDAKFAAKAAAEEAEREKVRKEEEVKAQARRREEEAAAAKRHAAELEEARKLAAEEAVAVAERNRANAERLKREDDERAEMERQRKAALAPDKEKAAALVIELESITYPAMKTNLGKAAIHAAQTTIASAIADLKRFGGAK